MHRCIAALKIDHLEGEEIVMGVVTNPSKPRAAGSTAHQYLLDDRPIDLPADTGQSGPERPGLDAVQLTKNGSDPAANRWQRIQRRAYELAEQRGFPAGAELRDWLEAEREIDAPFPSPPPNESTG
jgi:hypothetical protein